jgi:branched-chain amino acid transport system substrate-binding protein
MVLAAGVGQLDGRTDEKAAIMAAMRGLTVADGPHGIVRREKFGNAVGRIVNTPVKTYENVSQIWTYDPEEFLVELVYSRDYPRAIFTR